MKHTDLSELKDQLGLSSVKFWEAVKVSPATGWRYENAKGRKIPEPVKELLRLKYILGIDISKIDEKTAPLIKRILSSDEATLEAANKALRKADEDAKTQIVQHLKSL